jgi:hypothetical protein
LGQKYGRLRGIRVFGKYAFGFHAFANFLKSCERKNCSDKKRKIKEQIKKKGFKGQSP